MVGGRRLRVAIGMLGIGLGLGGIAAPVAAADPAPADPVVPAVPVTAPAAAPAAPVTAAAAALPAAPAGVPAPAAPPSAPDAAAAAITPPDGVQHLPSPESLPPGTTQDPQEHPKVGLLRDIWHALRNGDVSGTDAIMMLGTRPIDPAKLAQSTPSNQVGPSAPAGADLPPAAADAPAASAPAPAPAPVVPAPADAVSAPAS